MKNIYKGANSVGQVLTDLMINPPTHKNGCAEETVELYQKEKSDILTSLKDKA